MPSIVPVSAIIPTRNRAKFLERFLSSLREQTVLPAEIVICDASDDQATAAVVKQATSNWQSLNVLWRYEPASRTGLAPQRNQAVAAATQTFVWFLDDDVILEPRCLEHLHQIMSKDTTIGGATATITNQGYQTPGKWSSRLMRWFEHGRVRQTYAAACVGPCWTFMPDTSSDLPQVSSAEWLIGCCSLYRSSALPSPPVPDHFEGGAFGEDLAASLFVGLSHRLVHVRDARCFHDSQGGDHKRSLRNTADQSLRNKYYIMTRILGKDSPRDLLDFAVFHLFSLGSLALKGPDRSRFFPMVAGYLRGVARLISGAVGGQ